ncbi:hypothetical protein CGZ80_05820 [Rhodopirellula sp. MGV]|nr:hypothetical protein CGZ80_05820 [Rhodopirellula sp. MGV]
MARCSHSANGNEEVLHSALYGQIDRTLVPFATTPFGDVVCFNARFENRVELWRHDDESCPENAVLASDFSQFVARLSQGE